jgi:hypothetical protein
MRRVFCVLLSLLFLTGCASTAATTPEADDAPVSEADADAPAGDALALTLPLTDVEPYEPWLSMEPDTVSADTMGDVLCDETLPDGTEIVCYWEPDHLTNPDHTYTKYWAVRRGDTLLRFWQENSGYIGGYAVTSFTNILGQDGFRIKAPRGAGYLAYDYYVLDENGTPRLLVDCANDVIETDVNGDGETELLWFYHSGRDAYYDFRRDGVLYMAQFTGLLEDALPFPSIAAVPLDGNAWQDGFLAVTITPGGWDVLGEALPKPLSLHALLRFDPEEVSVYLPAEQVPLDWAAKTYALVDGVPSARDWDGTDWAALGDAVAAPASWADETIDSRRNAKTWSGIEPDVSVMQLVNAQDGWLAMSMNHGVGGADTYVYRTHDGGVTWTEAAPLTEAQWLIERAAFLDGQRAVLAIAKLNGASVFVTSDGGETWTQASFPLDEGDTVDETVNIYAEQDSLYVQVRTALAEGYQTFRSDDSGQTWQLDQ